MIGHQAGYNGGTQFNPANGVLIGYEAGYSASGEHTIAVGSSTCRAATGSGNIGIGTDALKTVTSGTWNVAIGRNAGYADSSNNPKDVTTGKYNTFLGAYTTTEKSDCEHSTAVGFGAHITKTDQIVLGRTFDAPDVYIPGNLGIGTTSPTEKLHVAGNAKITGTVTGNLTGNVTGDVTGDVTGNLTGNVTGDVTGNVTGNVQGPTDGNLILKCSKSDGVLEMRDASDTARIEIYGSNHDSKAGNAYYDSSGHYFRNYDASEDYMCIDSSGNVGIGIKSPSSTLDVSGTLKISNGIDGNLIVSGSIYQDDHDFFLAYRDQNPGLNWITKTNCGRAIVSSSSASGKELVINYDNDFSGGTVIQSDLSVTGDVTAPSFNATSDYRVKENVQTISGNIYTVDNLRPVSYVLKESQESHIGFIAHELQEHVPTAVKGEKDGDIMQSVNYSELIPILVKEIQDLKQEVRSLKTQLNKQ